MKQRSGVIGGDADRSIARTRDADTEDVSGAEQVVGRDCLEFSRGIAAQQFVAERRYGSAGSTLQRADACGRSAELNLPQGTESSQRSEIPGL